MAIQSGVASRLGGIHESKLPKNNTRVNPTGVRMIRTPNQPQPALRSPVGRRTEAPEPQ